MTGATPGPVRSSGPAETKPLHGEERATRTDEPIKVLYSAGFGRNGGTLLDRILGEVDGFVSLGEFRMVWQKGLINNELCNCGAPFRECPFWNRVFDRAFGGIDTIDANEMLELAESVDKTRHLPLLVSPWKPRRFRRRVEAYRRVMSSLYRAISHESGGRVLVDSSRFAGTALILDSLPEIRLYLLHLVRDSRATCYSWQRKKRKLEVVDEVRYLHRYNVLESSFWWMLRNVAVEVLRRGRRYLFLRYEDFVQSPSAALERILAFTGETGRALPLQGSRSVVFGESHTQSGNPNRFQRGPTEIRLDDEWRAKLGPVKKMLITLLTLPLLVRYGYGPGKRQREDQRR